MIFDTVYGKRTVKIIRIKIGLNSSRVKRKQTKAQARDGEGRDVYGVRMQILGQNDTVYGKRTVKSLGSKIGLNSSRVKRKKRRRKQKQTLTLSMEKDCKIKDQNKG
ncbi:hypothetical protein TNCV_1486841 [Trichonephila clavipes]|nr:hypothetical protein TNCV_1486841 [Trichonephila clavipes]